MKTIIKSIFFCLMFSVQAHAYFVAIPADQKAPHYNQSVRILVSGRGGDLGELPQKSALTRYQLYKRNFANDQVVLISVFENDRNEEFLRSKGWKFVVNNDINLETNSASKEILKYTKIRSLEFFGHNSPSLGTQADGLGFRFDFRRSIVKSIASHFTEDAFAMIHGCNSGWLIAPELSKIWKITVGGSFTGTRFERLHSDGHFYVASEEKAPNLNWAKTNPYLGTSCGEGGCLRMRPAFSRYKGKWGDFDGPLLSHYKFFCQKETAECEKAMALSLYGFIAERPLHPQSSFAEFSQVAKEWLCPVYKDRSKVEDCYQKLDDVEAGRGSMFISFVVNDEQLSCNLQSCKAVMTCEEHSCTVTNRSSKNSDTLAQEYLHLLNGFRALQAEGL